MAKDQDQELSFFIGRGFQHLKITREDVRELAYLSAIPEAEEDFVPDSSLRYLLAVDPRSERTALQTHLAFVEGKPISEIPLSFKRILSPQFYDYVKKRLLNVKRLDRLTVPELSLEKLDRPVSDILHKNFVVVGKDTPLTEVLQKFKESKSEVIVVVDKNDHIVGTLSATDLIHYARE